jgi:dUTP pyrophosphatase
MYIKYAKTREVKSPTRANHGDAGIDFYIPVDFPEITLHHGDSVLIPSGIKVEVPFGTALIFHNKSGVASKKKLDVMADTVDHGYAGEVHINLINNGKHEVTIGPGDKIIQGIHIPVFASNPIEVDESELYTDIHVIGDRGNGGFGSSGTK